MALYVELLLTLATIAAAAYAAKSLGRSRLWLLAFLFGLLATTLVILGHRSVRLSFVPPISWAILPHVSPILMGVAIPIMLGVLVVRLPEKRKRIMVTLLAAAMILYFGLMPLVVPLAARASLLSTPTRLTTDNICLQQHSYSCGPAAGVTCLRVFNVEAEEGTLAATARTAPAFGTDGYLLAQAISDIYASRGIRAQHRYIETLADLRLPAVAAIRSPQYGGHYIAVLAIDQSTNTLTIGDPLIGRQHWSKEEFLSQWTHASIEISKTPNPRLP